MFNWFKKNNETNKLKAKYKELDDGYIEIYVNENNYIGSRRYPVKIHKSMIESCTKETIVFNRRETHWSMCMEDAIETKRDQVELENYVEMTCEYDQVWEYWDVVSKRIIETKEVSKKTPVEIFAEMRKNGWGWKLIETEDEFNEYLASTLDCNTWCRRKLYNKMKELGLGDGFINEFADLIGNDLNKYYAMIDLASEVSDKDTLMYLYTYKFGKR